MFFQSANQSTTEWGSLAHDQTDFVINAGTGSVVTGVPFRPVAKTTAEMTALSATAGDTVYNSDYGITFTYNGNTWQSQGATKELINKAGGPLAEGDVVVYDGSNDDACTTTTSSADTTVAGVVLVGGAVDSRMTVAQLITMDVYVGAGSVTRGQWIRAGTSSRTASGTSTTTAGVFGRALRASASNYVRAAIWPTELI
jgi:hypothetical protein